MIRAEPEDSATRVHEALLTSASLRPADLSGPDERAWLDCDLASLAEHRLGEPIDAIEQVAAHPPT